MASSEPRGPRFISKALEAWADQHGVALVFIDPGKPIQNAHVESFNSKVRDEFLNENWLLSIHEAQVLGEPFRIDFNIVRPHSSLKNRTPEEFVKSLAGSSAAPADPQRSRVGQEGEVLTGARVTYFLDQRWEQVSRRGADP